MDVTSVNLINLIDNFFEDEAQKVTEQCLLNAKDEKYLCITTTLEIENVIDLESEAALRKISSNELAYKIASNLSSIGMKVISALDGNCAAYLSGGDISQEFIKGSGAAAIDIEDEIVPLAVYGKLGGGLFNGLPRVVW